MKRFGLVLMMVVFGYSVAFSVGLPGGYDVSILDIESESPLNWRVEEACMSGWACENILKMRAQYDFLVRNALSKTHYIEGVVFDGEHPGRIYTVAIDAHGIRYFVPGFSWNKVQ